MRCSGNAGCRVFRLRAGSIVFCAGSLRMNHDGLPEVPGNCCPANCPGPVRSPGRICGPAGLTRLGTRLVSTCFDSAAIDTRYTAVAELTKDSRAENPRFFDPATGLLLSPSTKVRNDIFATEATKLFIEAAQKALDACPGIDFT